MLGFGRKTVSLIPCCRGTSTASGELAFVSCRAVICEVLLG